MARNNHEWFKFEFRAWMESRRVQRMSLAAQALYIRALCVQAMQGNIPSNPSDAAIELRVLDLDLDAWNECLAHFVEETIDGSTYLYNEKLRSFLYAASEKKAKLSELGAKGGKNAAKAKGKAKGAAKGKAKAAPKGAAKGAIRASSSNSNSYSNSLLSKFDSFWLVYPKKKSKAEALESWKKVVTTEELADLIISHTENRAKTDIEWIKDGGMYVPNGSTFLNQRRWEDEYRVTPAHGIPSLPSPRWQRPEPQGFDMDILGAGSYTPPAEVTE